VNRIISVALLVLALHAEGQTDSVNDQLDEVVVSGTLYGTTKSASPVNIDVVHRGFLTRQRVPSLFEALQFINGIRPQVNCGVCSTGDIHLNGMEGPYTMVLIDGSPVVSGLASVYGLMGIPSSLIDRIEVIKGPASTLYGSEAVAGVINIITKRPESVPRAAVDVLGTSHGERTLDFSVRSSGRGRGLWGIHHYASPLTIDQNGDGFTDLPIQNRISIVYRRDRARPNGLHSSVYARAFGETRWGGQLNFDPRFKGLDSAYGEHIATGRVELSGTLRSRTSPSVLWSWTSHRQRSWYGTTPYNATQHVGFIQPTWQHRSHRFTRLVGLAVRATYYNDNSPATEDPKLWWSVLPGAFGQLEHHINDRWTQLGGIRIDHAPMHGLITTPRYNLLYRNSAQSREFRLGGGRGFRIANVFTEDHAALTGSRTVVFEEALRPETSWNANAVLTLRRRGTRGWANAELGAFATYFGNRIVPDYSSVQEIRYANLDGYGVNRGISANLTFGTTFGLRASFGGTLMDNFLVESGQGREVPMLTERAQGVWDLSYERKKLMVSYSGTVIGPMDLPLFGPDDPRSSRSPWFSLQNASARWTFARFGVGLHGYNLLGARPSADRIARAHDPFDRFVAFGPDGAPLATPENPFALVFDPSSVYASFQGRRWGISANWALD
jgi:outer membrane receptor for ferrienterochelin and colicins